jgi:hypothetical protein
MDPVYLPTDWLVMSSIVVSELEYGPPTVDLNSL